MENSSKPDLVPHSRWVQALIWFNSLSLIGCGAAAFILQFFRDGKKVSHFFVSFYWVIFGIISVLVQLRLPIAGKFFGFAYSKYGQALFFIFAGTLGISFGVGKSPGVLIPFIAGIISVLIGAVCFTDTAVGKHGTTANVDAVV